MSSRNTAFDRYDGHMACLYVSPEPNPKYRKTPIIVRKLLLNIAEMIVCPNFFIAYGE